MNRAGWGFRCPCADSLGNMLTQSRTQNASPAVMAHELIFLEVFITFSPLFEFAPKYSALREAARPALQGDQRCQWRVRIEDKNMSRKIFCKVVQDDFHAT